MLEWLFAGADLEHMTARELADYAARRLADNPITGVRFNPELLAVLADGATVPLTTPESAAVSALGVAVPVTAPAQPGRGVTTVGPPPRAITGANRQVE